MGHAPEMVAVLNNVVLGLMVWYGQNNIYHAKCNFAYNFEKI